MEAQTYNYSELEHRIIPLSGVQVVNIQINEITYEAVVFQDLDEVLRYLGIIVECSELGDKRLIRDFSITRKTDTCVEFTLQQKNYNTPISTIYYDPTIYDFQLAVFVKRKS